MIIFLFLLFLCIPLVEIAVFIEVGGRLGLWPTIGIVLLTAGLGTILFRIQGLSILHQARANLGANVFPAREVFNGLCLLVAGALLITPGFVTDGFGFLLFFPPFRHFLRRIAERRLTPQSWPDTPGTPPGDEMGNKTIEGVYWEIGSETPPEQPPAPPEHGPNDPRRKE